MFRGVGRCTRPWPACLPMPANGMSHRELGGGAGGRTAPRLAELVEAECRVEVLYVLHLHLEEPET